VSGATQLPGAARACLIAGGALLTLLAIRSLRRDAGPQGAAPVPWIGRVVLWASAAAARLEALRREGDGALLHARLAVAPDSRPARWTAAALTAWRVRAASSPADPARLPELEAVAAGIRLIAGLLAAAPVAGAAAAFAGPAAAAVLGLLAFAAATRVPDLLLRAAAARARRAAAAEAAATADMLAAASAAGLALPGAMVLAAGHAPPAAAAVLRAAAVRRALGEEPRAAWTSEAERYGVPALGEVAEALDRQRRLGVPLAPELSRIAARLRADERARALQRAARRGPLGTLVVALLIAPVCLAAVVACLAGGLLESGGLGLR